MVYPKTAGCGAGAVTAVNWKGVTCSFVWACFWKTPATKQQWQIGLGRSLNLCWPVSSRDLSYRSTKQCTCWFGNAHILNASYIAVNHWDCSVNSESLMSCITLLPALTVQYMAKDIHSLSCIGKSAFSTNGVSCVNYQFRFHCSCKLWISHD